MESAAVEIIEEDVQAWLEHKSKSALFDIILVDVPIGEHHWLSVEMYGKLPYRLEDAITVVSSGSAPSLFDIDTETVLSPREMLIRQGARPTANGGFGVNILVYDEVR
jgi:spermidine synthase